MSMSKEDLELMALLLEEEGFELERQETIPRRDPSVTPRLSFSQQRLWFLYQLTPDDPSYNISSEVRITGTPNVEVLERCFNEIIRRHEVLRTSFHNENGEPLQIFHQDVRLTIPVIDLSGLPEEEQASEVERVLLEEVTKPFDITVVPLLRLTMLKLGEFEYRLSLSIHHIVSDGWSSGVFIAELAALYEAFLAGKPSPLPELPIQFADYSQWLETQLQGEVTEELIIYWKQKLSGNLPVMQLPVDRPRPANPTFHGAMHPFRLEETTKARLLELGLREEATLYMMLLAAFHTLFFRYFGQEDQLVGTPIAGRGRSELEGLIGFLSNTLVLRTDISGNPTFRELIGRVRQTALEGYAHQDLPFVKLVEEVQPDRSQNNPLFQVVFSLQNTPLPELHLPGMVLHLNAIESKSAKFDLALYMTEEVQGISGLFEYSTDLFDKATIARMASHFQAIITAVVDNPDLRLSDIPLLDPAERHQLVVEWNDTACDYGKESNIAQLFEAQVARTPDAVAVVCANDSLTYRELNRQANRLAHALQKRGVTSGSLVGLCMERSPELIVSTLAIVKTGAAYVPLDPQYPQERLRFMLEDTGLSVLVAQSHLLANLPAESLQVIDIDRERESLAQESDTNWALPISSDSLAYVMYTSGSTGFPKGVLVPQRGVMRLVKNQHYVKLDAEEVLLQFAPVSFDAATLEIWGALLNGARLVVFPAHKPSLEELGRVLHEHGVTTMWLTAALFNQMVEGHLADLRPLRQLLVGGDVVSALHAQKVLAAFPHIRLMNMYGPTENTTFTTGFHVRDAASIGATVPIGRPIANSEAYILDSFLQPVPQGIPGELCIGGAGLAYGYLNRPELTAEKFMQHPFSPDPSARLYRTGDLARHLPDGNIEFLGRLDSQVKIRGFRIELGEIETALGGHPLVQSVVVIAREDVPGDKRLVAYLVPDTEAVPSVEALRGYLADKLPDYMTPSAFVVLPELPITANGKVDRKALPAPEGGTLRSETEYVAPRNRTEEQLAHICSELLGVERVGVFDDFFELGGHSLLATQLISRVRATFGVELSLRSLFNDPTVGALARVVAQEQAKQQHSAAVGKPAIQAVSRIASRVGEEEVFVFPASFSQRRMWFLDQFAPGTSMFNVAGVGLMRGRLDIDALERSFHELTRRHESLRTTFAQVDGQVMQVVHADLSGGFSRIDLDEADEAEREAKMWEILSAEAKRPFDLVHGPLLRVTLVKKSEQEQALSILHHHIITDGWSVGIFFQELMTLYAAFSQGHPSPLPELALQYADYSLWQLDWLQGEQLETQLVYWKEQLGGELPVLQLPTDHPRPAVQSYRGHEYVRMLPKKLLDGLTAWSQQEGVTLYMTLLSAFKTLLHRYSGQTDLLVGTPIAGRNHADIEGIIGLFVNTLVMRTDLSGDPTFRELVMRVRDVALGAYAHQEMPFEKLIEELQPVRNTSHSPVFQVMFALQNMPMEPLVLPELTLTRVDTDTASSQFDMMMLLTERAEGLHLQVQYSTDLFTEATIARMIDHLHVLLEAVLAAPEQRLSEIHLLTAEEHHRMLVEWNDNALPLPDGICLHDLFFRQAARTPDAVALVCGERRLTYAELQTRATALATYLQTRGVGAEVLVGINMERSPEMVVAILGVLQAGGAYVPLDPNYPTDRLGFLLEDARVSVLITQERLLDHLPPQRAEVICLDRDASIIAQVAAEEPLLLQKGNLVQPSHLAYVIYTSGSTGRPKGVAIEHRSAVAMVAWAHTVYTPEQLAGVLFSTSICFDLSVFELFVTLSRGGKVILADNALQLPHLAAASEVTLINTVPSAITELLRLNAIPSSVRTINLAGEPLRRTLVDALYQVRTVEQVYNLYGPSEDTTYSTFALVEKDPAAPVTIGRPIANTQVYLLDARMQPVPVLVPGELHLGGEGLARGYLNRPELTAEKFVPNPFASNAEARLYKTGDLARYLPDGTIEYVGRIDHQVKIRGFRIELGEIEVVLGQHPAVREAVVVAREELPGDVRLTAYLVPVSDQEPTVADLRSALGEKLPDYMIPSAFVMLGEVPLSPNGKVDRKALPAPDGSLLSRSTEYVAPRDRTEELVAGMCAELLNVERIGVNDNFFELGGHSLLATQLITRVRTAFGVDLSLRSLFQEPTVARVALAIAQLQAKIQQETAEAKPALKALTRESYRVRK